MTLGLLIGVSIGAVLGFFEHNLGLGVMVGIAVGALLGRAISKYHLRSKLRTLLHGPPQPKSDHQPE
jgi:uncharacterized protein YqgC (DUF456 family)